MKKVAILILSFIVTSFAIAASTASLNRASHNVLLTGLNPGEGRFVLSTEYINNKFYSGTYSCKRANDSVYMETYQLPKSQEPFHEEHLIKFSICQDETLANCQEFAVDKYLTFRNIDGYLQNDVTHASVDLSPVKNTFQACEPNSKLDKIVKNAIHISDRRFAHVG